MKTYWRSGGITSALDGSEYSTSHPSHFTPEVRVPNTHWIRGPHNLSAVAGRKKSQYCPCWELSFGHPAYSLVPILTM